MDRITMLVREAVQNSWDARLAEPISFGIAAWILPPEHLQVLRTVVFTHDAPDLSLHAALDEPEGCPVLAIYDRGTTGLGGPTRADTAADPGQPTNFVDFLRHVGQPPGRPLGGGTYGFGKAAYYLASRVRTICVHTRCAVGEGTESRFMAAALGPGFTAGEERRTRYTGRHWWGRTSHDGVVEPVRGLEADALAAAIGLPPHDGTTGTTILILRPDLDDRPLRELLSAAGEAVLRYCWPKLIDGAGGGPSINFILETEGAQIDLPRVDETPPFSGFARALRNATRPVAAEAASGPFTATVPIVWRRQGRSLGTLSLVRMQPRPPAEADAAALRPFIPPCRHVALMRAPHLIVKYVEGPAVPYDQMEYAGVFVVDRDVDAVFARAEPPTHDDWTPSNMEAAAEQTMIRVAFREINAALKQFSAPPTKAPEEGADVPLGAFADRLGGLIATVPGPGASTPRGTGSGGGGGGPGGRHGGSGRASARIRIEQDGRLELVRGKPALVVDFIVEHVLGVDDALVEAVYGVVVDGGALEGEPPSGAEIPILLEWRSPAGEILDGAPRVQIPSSVPGRWSVAVSLPKDAATTLDLRVVREGLP
jgi:hypothetical protein